MFADDKLITLNHISIYEYESEVAYNTLEARRKNNDSFFFIEL